MKKLIFSLVFMLMIVPLCATDLIFSNDAKETMNILEALYYCDDLKENGASDWRLPTTEELSGLNKNEGNYWASDRNKIETYYLNEAKAWLYDFSAKKKEESVLSTTMNVVCVRNNDDKRDKNACKFADNEWKNNKNIESWIDYYQKFPKGLCVEKAEEAIYENAKKLDNRAGWETYLRIFPKGAHELEARSEHKKKKNDKIGNLEWSDRSPNRVKWKDAENYCKNLKENGTGWKLPDIDELRTLVEGRKTATGGACKVSKRTNCLVSGEKNGCWTRADCAQACKKKDEKDEKKGFKCPEDIKDGRYSKLGDAVWLWSSCKDSGDTSFPWGLDFRDGHIGLYSDDTDGIYVRCVR